MRHKLNVTVFAAMLVCFAAIVTLFPRDTRTIERENRALNVLPEISAQSLLSGKFAAGFGPYLSDRVGYRTAIIDIARTMEKARGFAPGGIRISDDTLALNDRIMEIYMRDTELEARYAAALSDYGGALPGGSRVFAVLVPTQLEFQNEVYSVIGDSQRESIDAVYSLLEGVSAIDAYSALSEHQGEYVFFRSDHHWTALGAYYAYLEFADEAGIVPKRISEFTERRADGFLGYLYSREPVTGLRPDTIVWYEYPGLETSAPLFYPPGSGERVTYGIFLGGDHDVYVIGTNAGTGRTAIVVKDSYANAFVPWLAPHYDTVVVIDPREYTGSVTELAARYGQVDLIFLNYVFSASFGDFIGLIEAVR